MKISIIIPVINEAGQIETSIERAWQSGADEVVVSDGGSTDGTRDLLAGLNCKLVESQPGRATQMNAGAAAATGDVFVFLHADNWLVDGGCDQIRELLSSTPDSFGGFDQTILSERRIYRWIENGNAWRVKWQGLVYGDQAMFIGKQRFQASGGFPVIELMEDFSFSKTLRRQGKAVLLTGPTFVSARRWEKNGPIRQTVMNWFLSFAYRLGASPKWIASRYGRHDK